MLPGGPDALSWLAERVRALPERGSVRLAHAWMAEALPELRPALRELADSGRLELGTDWSALSPYALLGFRPLNRALGASVLAAWPGATPVPSVSAGDGASHVGRAGLCLEQRTLADRIVARLGGAAIGADPRPLAGPLLAALSPAGIGGAGGCGSEAHALATLGECARLLGLDAAESPLDMQAAARERRGARHLELGVGPLVLRLSRGRGFSWQLGEARVAAELCSLEVQGDAGGRAAFVANHPPRPRVFRASDMKRLLHETNASGARLVLERELRLPRDATDPDSPHGRTRWRLDIRAGTRPGRVEFRVELHDPVPGQRYRLWFPVPFFPRPTGLVVVDASGRTRRIEQEGALQATPVMSPVSLRNGTTALEIGGPGVREVEIFPRANDYICATTLLRTPAGEAPPVCCSRWIGAVWRSVNP